MIHKIITPLRTSLKLGLLRTTGSQFPCTPLIVCSNRPISPLLFLLAITSPPPQHPILSCYLLHILLFQPHTYNPTTSLPSHSRSFSLSLLAHYFGARVADLSSSHILHTNHCFWFLPYLLCITLLNPGLCL